MKNNNFANLQNVGMLTGEELIYLKNLLTSTYGRLQTIRERARNATEDPNTLVKIEAGMGKYDQDYDIVLQHLDEERSRRALRTEQREQEGTAAQGTGSLYPNLQDLDNRTSDPSQRSPHSGDFYIGDTPYRSRNPTPLGQTENSDGRQVMTGGLGNQTPIGSTHPNGPGSSSSSPYPSRLSGKTKKKKGKKKQNCGPRGTGSQPVSRNLTLVNVGQGTSSARAQVDGLDVARLAQAASSAGWDATRTRLSIERFYETGVFPSELGSLPDRGDPRSSTAASVAADTSQNFRSRVVDFDIPQSNAPSFVTGPNSRPLGITAPSGIWTTSFWLSFN